MVVHATCVVELRAKGRSVRRAPLDALAPGGGYVFNAVRNIQADVPPENTVAMIEALRGA